MNGWNPELVGGFTYFLCSPQYLGKMNPIWRAYVSDGLKPPTRWAMKTNLGSMYGLILYLHDFGEKWPHSRGHVGQCSLLGSFGRKFMPQTMWKNGFGKASKFSLLFLIFKSIQKWWAKGDCLGEFFHGYTIDYHLQGLRNLDGVLTLHLCFFMMFFPGFSMNIAHVTGNVFSWSKILEKHPRPPQWQPPPSLLRNSLAFLFTGV